MKMNKIKEALSKLIAETFERISTDKGILALDGALEDMEVGMAVSFVDEEGNEVAAEDGDYVLEDGRILRIAEGKIAEIVEPEAEVPAEEEAPAEEPVAEEAEEAAEEPEVENPTNEGEETETEAVVKLREEVNELYELVHRLEDRIAELEKKPAAEPASEEFKKSKKVDAFKASKDAHYNLLADLNKA